MSLLGGHNDVDVSRLRGHIGHLMSTGGDMKSASMSSRGDMAKDVCPVEGDTRKAGGCVPLTGQNSHFMSCRGYICVKRR